MLADPWEHAPHIPALAMVLDYSCVKLDSLLNQMFAMLTGHAS
jgi:hypothetical protein